MTEKHNLLTNSEFEKKVENCNLPDKHFTHEAHLRLAYIHIKKYGVLTAIDNLCSLIYRFDDKNSGGKKFNKTLTVASVKVVYHFMSKTKSTDFRGLINEFPRLRDGFLDLLKYHYSFDILNNKSAKEQYVEPDLLAFG